MSARFSFTGKLIVTDKPGEKGHYLREGKTKGKVPSNYRSINLQVAAEKNNRAYVELFGSEQDEIKTMSTENEKITIDWGDRFDKKVIDNVASYKKTVIKIGDDRNEFIAPYDAIEFFAEHLDELKDTNVTITGQRSKNLYQDKLSDRFQITGIYPAADDATNRLEVNMDFFFNKESIDTTDWRKEHKLYINGWTEEYLSDLKDNRYVPQKILFDCSKVDWENEKHVQMVNFRLKILGCELDDDNKVVVKLKKGIYKIGVKTTFINGSEEAEFNESMLTEIQKMAVEMGVNTLEDFKPSKKVYGESVIIYKLRDFNMRKDSGYENGAVDTEITIKEFDEKVWAPSVETSVDEIDKDAEESTTNEAEDDEDLFG